MRFLVDQSWLVLGLLGCGDGSTGVHAELSDVVQSAMDRVGDPSAHESDEVGPTDQTRPQLSVSVGAPSSLAINAYSLQSPRTQAIYQSIPVEYRGWFAELDEVVTELDKIENAYQEELGRDRPNTVFMGELRSKLPNVASKFEALRGPLLKLSKTTVGETSRTSSGLPDEEGTALQMISSPLRNLILARDNIYRMLNRGSVVEVSTNNHPLTRNDGTSERSQYANFTSLELLRSYAESLIVFYASSAQGLIRNIGTSIMSEEADRLNDG